ncbi:aspartate/glutamate racemase family protein [Clostridium sp. Marseille-P2415]|uniref:aspartate/glutamate racemase family protein n=1 Tax=Clostridium sp. Marseille-P2415 TaxID=1805471 RepID=UPI0011157C4F|nr:aspartate/glutamate racemase family protein [Clostridium sp. Marseille-P2415]
MKKKIALVSVTLNAVNPMTDFLNQQEEPIEIRNYLDSYLLQKVREDGGMNDSSMKRMFQMLATACEDGADGILMTCTIFSPYAEHFSALLSKPVICPDGAMLDRAAWNGGKTAILCTFEGTVNTTREMYFSYCRKYQRPERVDMHVLSDAYEAMQRGRFKECDSIIQNKVRELDGQYDQIVLAQISMSQAAAGVKLNHAKLYTSPDSAYRAIKEAMQERG